MPIGNFSQFRSFLTQISASAVPDQLSFIHLANACVSDSSLNGKLADLNNDARWLLSANGSKLPPADRVRWLRWKSDDSASGVALSLVAAGREYLLLPEKTDPPRLCIQKPVAADMYILLPSLETIARSSGAKLAYIHRERLQTYPRPWDDEKRFARFMRLIDSGKTPPLPTFRYEKGFPLYWIDEQHGGVHGAVLALQKGMEFVLGEIRNGGVPAGTISLEGAARAYSSYSVTLTDAPDLKDALPADDCLGAGDPFYVKIKTALDEQKPLRDADGTVVGWARIVAGGKDGRLSDPVSGLSAETSAGLRPNQEDGFYVAHFRTHDGRDVRVFITADGLGGNELGEMASSAALQGVHAAIVRALREKRIPLAADLFQAAREALEAQTLFEEVDTGSGFSQYTAPNTVISVGVAIDGEATIATAGDVITALCARDEKGRVVVLGHTLVDASSDNVVDNTLRHGRPRLYRVRIPKGAWLVSLTDGAMGGLSPTFKRHTSQTYREAELTWFAEQDLFRNLLRVLDQAQPDLAGPALHDAASGNSNDPSLRNVVPDNDNWTAVGLHFNGEYKEPDFSLPEAYGPLESVYPANQYVYQEGPYAISPSRIDGELTMGSRLHPQEKPTIIWTGDTRLTPLHARVEKVNEAGAEKFILEKLTGYGRISIKDKGDKHVASLAKKGTRHEIKPGQLIKLTQRTFFRFH